MWNIDHGGTLGDRFGQDLEQLGPSQAPSHTGAIVFFDQSELLLLMAEILH